MSQWINFDQQHFFPKEIPIDLCVQKKAYTMLIHVGNEMKGKIYYDDKTFH
jgi:hypothetical protein